MVAVIGQAKTMQALPGLHLIIFLLPYLKAIA